MKEIEKYISDAELSFNYKLVNLGGNYLYIEGIKSVVKMEQNEMQFQLKKKLLNIAGENLKIKYLDKNTCVLLGEIFLVEVK